MEKKLKTLLAICLGTILMVMMAGCGSDDSANNQTQPEQNTTQQQQTQENKTQEETKAKTDYSQYIGSYLDSKSNRATMEVKENVNGEGVAIHVHWSTSASESLEWDMRGTLDGNKMVYSDCVKSHHVYDSDANKETTNEKMELDPKGYFEISNGAWNWTGSPETDCQACSFAKK